MGLGETGPIHQCTQGALEDGDIRFQTHHGRVTGVAATVIGRLKGQRDGTQPMTAWTLPRPAGGKKGWVPGAVGTSPPCGLPGGRPGPPEALRPGCPDRRVRPTVSRAP